MAQLNEEQRNYIQNKMNEFLRMSDWKYTKESVLQKVHDFFIGKRAKVIVSSVSYKNGDYNAKEVCLGFEPICDVSIPQKFINMMAHINLEYERRRSVVQKIQEKIIFGAQAEEMKELLALLK